jgi:hypothetical protein
MARTTTAQREDSTSCGHVDLKGKIARETLVRLELDSGSTIVAPEEMMFKPGAIGDIGDIIDIACKLTGWCGGDTQPPAPKMCPKIVITPDGTITVTMVPCGTAIA